MQFSNFETYDRDHLKINAEIRKLIASSNTSDGASFMVAIFLNYLLENDTLYSFGISLDQFGKRLHVNYRIYKDWYNSHTYQLSVL